MNDKMKELVNAKILNIFRVTYWLAKRILLEGEGFI